jgi:hemoglobin-like flavoprotein
MTREQVTVVQQSFAKVAPIADQADRLFETAPQVRAMFPADMAEQQKKLMATLGVVVNGLSNLESVLPAASALAKRHVAYGAKLEDYPVVGSALLWTLERAMGGCMDEGRRGRLDHGVRYALRLHDRTGLWSPQAAE